MPLEHLSETFGGSLSNLRADDLATAHTLKELMGRNPKSRLGTM